MPRSRSFTRLTMRVGLLHLGQSVDLVVSITFWRSPVFAIFAMGCLVLLLGLSLHTRTETVAASTARSCCSALSVGTKRKRDSLGPVYIRPDSSVPGALSSVWLWARVSEDPPPARNPSRREYRSCQPAGVSGEDSLRPDSRLP